MPQTSDPLTQFACVLCALIHDVDHTGLPNSVLVNESTPLAKAYNNRSVAEQNSIDLAWDALMGLQYTELRQAIYQTKEEFQRFRQLMVNAVLATDIMDKELKALRNSRWEKTFADKSQASDTVTGDNDVNRKATIVIEHIIQASDVSHTMQHWYVVILFAASTLFYCTETHPPSLFETGKFIASGTSDSMKSCTTHIERGELTRIPLRIGTRVKLASWTFT